jgi:DNA-binding NarL/FixJ family response regulator
MTADSVARGLMAKLQFLIADDHAVVRRGIRSLLESHSGWSVCAEVSNGREAVEQTRRLAPDVILLDLSMPELDGLQATREIVSNDRDAQVLILTVHESDDIAPEARRFGAKGVVDKYVADETLIPAIESLLGNLVHLGGSIVGHDRHIAALFHSQAEQYRTLGPFVAEGLSRGEKAVHIIDPPSRQSHVDGLRASGVDLLRAEAAGHARLLSWTETYLRDNRFDQGAMLDLFPELLGNGSSKGVPLTRLVANMEWALSGPPGVEDLVQYESRLNDVLQNFNDVVICVYDLAKFGGAIVIDVICAHPAVLIGDTLAKNPFYVAPRQWTGDDVLDSGCAMDS